MYRREKEALRAMFAAVPAPSGKKEFLRRQKKPGISLGAFWIRQAAYIHKGIWALSLVVFGTAVLGASLGGKEMLGMISALLPFVAAATVTENARSAFYGMEELEMAARFSLKSLTLARMGILGIANATLIILVTPFCMGQGKTDLFETGVYLLTPYLLATVLEFKTVRKIREKDAGYACFGISAAVSFFLLFIGAETAVCYQRSAFIWWLSAAGILAVMLGKELGRRVRMTEEYAWS